MRFDLQGIGEGKRSTGKNVCICTLEVKKATTSAAERTTVFSPPTLADWHPNNLGCLVNAYKLPGTKINW